MNREMNDSFRVLCLFANRRLLEHLFANPLHSLDAVRFGLSGNGFGDLLPSLVLVHRRGIGHHGSTVHRSSRSDFSNAFC